MRQTLGTAARAQSSSGCGSSHHAACSCHLRGGSVAGARPQPNRGWRVVGAVSHASHCEGPGRESHANKIHSGPRKVRQKGARQQCGRTPQCTTMAKNINSQLGSLVNARSWRLVMFIALSYGAALVLPLHSARGVAPCSRSPLRTTRRAGTACCQAQQPDQQPPGDEQITSFTDEDGVNRLIGRKIESPGDWIEARSMSEGTPQPPGEPNERGCSCGLWVLAARPAPFARRPHIHAASFTPGSHGIRQVRAGRVRGDSRGLQPERLSQARHRRNRLDVYRLEGSR